MTATTDEPAAFHPANDGEAPVKRDGTRNRNWRGWSGNLDGYTRVVRRES